MPTRSQIGLWDAALAGWVGDASTLPQTAIYRQAAALPWRHGHCGVEVLLVTSSGGKRWVVPKGWPLAGESLADAAMRETWEEAGAEGGIDAAPLGQFIHVKTSIDRPPRACLVSLFPMQVLSVSDRWPEGDRRRRAWMPPSQAVACMRHPDLAAMIADFTPPQPSGPR